MTSTHKIIADSLSSLGSKLTSVLALFAGFPIGSQRVIYSRLNKQIQEILINFTFLLPLSDCLNKWIGTEDENLRSLAVQIQITIEKAAKKVKPEDVDNVFRDVRKITEESEPQAVQVATLLWIKGRTPGRALKLFDVLKAVNNEIRLLKPEIKSLCRLPMLHSTHISHTPPREIFSCKEFGFGWLVSSSCSCLSEIERETIGHAYHLEVLELRKNLSNLQMFLHSLSDIPGIEDIADKVACEAIRTLLLACQWWVRKYKGFTARFDKFFNDTLSYQRKKISADNRDTLAQVLGLLKSLKAIDHSLFNEKVIQFAQYILPNVIGLVEFTREKASSAITISTQIQMEPQGLQSILTFSPHFKELILEIERSLSCWLPEDGPFMINLLANVCLMRVEAIFIQRIRYRGRFTYPFNISGKWIFQYSKEWPEESNENVNQILKFLDEVVLLRDIPFSNIPYPDTIVECLILVKVQLFKLKTELEKYNENSKFSLKDKIQSVQDWSELLINCFVRSEKHTEQFHNTCRKYEVGIESMVKTVVSSCNSFLNQNYISDEMVQGADHIFSSLVDDIRNIMAEIAEELCLFVRMSNLPKTNALGFYDILLGKMRELMDCKAILFLSFKQYIEELLDHLNFFRNFLEDNIGPERETQELRDLSVHVLDVAYEAEYLIDSIVLSDIYQWQISIWLYNFLPNLRHIKRQVSEIYEKKKVHDVQVHNIPQSLRHKVLKASTPRIDDTVQSLNDEQNLIIDRLLQRYRQRVIVSIVGMPGIGKTTLAKQVYNSCTVVNHFHIRAWCCVGEVYQKRALLLEILSHIIVLTENILGKSTEDLEFKLRQHLLKQKYLIVIDDMWSTEAWNDLQTSLPENENGSCILITSRSHHIGLKAEAHYLRLLSDAESWALLQMKIFDEDCCPGALIEIGQEIAKNCKGLPLAVVAMAGILKRTDKQEKSWKEIAKDLSSQVVDDPHEQCRDILELSYKFLPENLKACFLYFGAFPEDQEIPVEADSIVDCRRTRGEN